MNKLRPVEDVWDELSVVEVTDEGALDIIQADRGETVLLCVEAAVTAITEYCKGTVYYEPIREAIYAVAKPPESDRERLGRTVREAWVRWAGSQSIIPPKASWLVPWNALGEPYREVDCLIGEAVRAELAKIQEEQKL